MGRTSSVRAPSGQSNPRRGLLLAAGGETSGGRRHARTLVGRAANCQGRAGAWPIGVSRRVAILAWTATDASDGGPPPMAEERTPPPPYDPSAPRSAPPRPTGDLDRPLDDPRALQILT